MIKKITLFSILFAFVLSTFAKEFKKEAFDYLRKSQKELKLSDQDVADLIVIEDNFDDYSKINRVWLQQTAFGLPLNNALVSVHFKDGKVVNSNSSGVYDLKKQIPNVTATLSASNAVVKAASYVNVTNIGTIKLQEKVDNKKKLYIFEPISGLSNIEVHAQLALTRDKQDKVKLAWFVQFHSLDEKNFWNIEVDAKTGALLNKTDQIIHCNFGTGKFLESNQTHNHSAECLNSLTGSSPNILPQGSNDNSSSPQAGAYRVFPFSVESPIYGSRQLVANPDDAVASPFGWHDDNGVAGAEYTITRGNNVYVYADKDGNNTPDAGSSPDGGASLNFDFPLDFSSQLDTLVNSKAIVTQLFYMNNIMHDVFFKHGFTDASRNFQVKNYVTGNLATDNDPVYAEAHDGSGTNNANFATAPDGTNSAFSRSRMQMFMWAGIPPSTLTYNSPSSIAGDILHGSQNGWGPCSYNVTGAVANATSNTAPASFVCGPVNNASQIAGKIALIDRGNCNFSDKVFNAQLSGAIGVIIINRQSAGDSLLGMAAGTNGAGVTIPAVIVTWADGEKLRNNLATANVTLFRQSTTNCLDLDGSLDNAIVAHEYGHGISIRLTGTGPTSLGNCLNNAEQAGEGWSDFFALALTKKAADTKNTPRGIGNYVISENTAGLGIRRYPYCYDMSVNPQTYADLNTDEDIYLNGEVWCSAAWDMYWNLVEKYGYSTDLYNGTGGNVRALKLIIEGLKQQPCSPGLLDGRNAILKADSILYGYADRCEIWSAFARRGMGFSASQGSSAVATDQIAAFNLHPLCNTSPTATANFTTSDTVVCIGSTLTFTNTSTASAGSPDSVRWTINGGTPSTSISTTTVTSTFNTVGTYTISLIAYKSGNASTAFTRSIRVRANAAASLTSATGSNAQTKCVSTAITNITYSITGGGTGAGVTGLPAGVTGTFAGGVFTISGTPTATGTFNYTVTTTGTCVQTTATGSIIVTQNAAMSLSSATGTNVQSKCVNTAITNITYTVTGGGTGAGVTGLPAGVTGVFSGGVFTISGTPTATGTFNYTVTTTGTCAQASLTGTITVSSASSTALSSASGTDNQSKCVNTAITNITYTITGATGATATGLPAGVTGTFAGGVLTISGTPTVSGPFSYTVTATGGCTAASSTGTITVNSLPTVAALTGTASACVGSTTTFSSTTSGGTWNSGSTSIATVNGSGVVSGVSAGTSMISYTVTSSGCSTTVTRMVTINALPSVTVTSPSICAGNTATITASGADSYTWTGGLTGNPATTPVLNSNASYTVTGTQNGCTNTAVSNVVVNSAAPTVAITSNPVDARVCIGSSITLTASGANNYTWSSTLGSVSGGTYTFTPTADVIVNLSGTVTGCSTAGTNSVAVNIKPLPTVAVNSSSICAGQTATLTATGGTTYTWTGGLTGNPVTTPVLNANASYTVTGTQNGCSNTAVANVTIKPTPSTPTITQSNDTLNSSTVVVGASYEWYLGGVLTATTSVPYYKFTANGSYTVKVINNGCPSVTSAAISASLTGIRNQTNSVKLFEVYPNPTEGRLIMNLNLYKTSSVNISIFTPEGREVYVKAYGNQKAFTDELNINEFAKGVYIIKLRVDEETYYHKVVKN